MFFKGFASIYGNTFKTCISGTDCFYVQSNWSPNFDVFVDNNAVLTGMDTVSKARFGYSSANGTIVRDFCDVYQMCHRNIQPGTMERKMINMITRFSGTKIFEDQSTPQYQAMCWWLNDLDYKNRIEFNESMLIQRYLLALIYFSNGGRRWHNTENWMTNLSECR